MILFDGVKTSEQAQEVFSVIGGVGIEPIKCARALCALSVLAAFLFVPDSEAEMTSIAVDADYFLQGTNWTWIPMASALCTGMLLPIADFLSEKYFVF